MRGTRNTRPIVDGRVGVVVASIGIGAPVTTEVTGPIVVQGIRVEVAGSIVCASTGNFTRWCATIGIQQAGAFSARLEQRLHAYGLSSGEQVHARILRVVHVVLYHIDRPAAFVADGTVEVRGIRFGGVGHAVVHSATSISPDVPQIQPVADLMGSGAAEVVNAGAGTVVAHKGISTHHTIGGSSTSWELSVAEQTSTQIAHPEIQIVGGRPCIRSTLSGEFHGVVGSKAGNAGRNPQNAIGGRAVGVKGGQTEFNLSICSLRPNVVSVAVEAPKVVIQGLQLLQNFAVRNVFCAVGVQNVKHHRDGHHNALTGGPLLLHNGLPFSPVAVDAPACFCVLL